MSLQEVEMVSDDLSDIQAKIKKQAKAAVFGGVVGLFFAGIIFGPGAMIRGSAAKNLILTHDTGQEHLSKANLGYNLGLAATVLWAALIVVRLVVM